MRDFQQLNDRSRVYCPLWMVLISCLLCGFVDNSSAIAGQPKPIYWKQRLFYIPYQVQNPQRARSPVRKVQLMISRDGVSNWQVLQEAEPHVQGFSYNAPEDGEYWFALRHIDRRGKPWPSASITAQMRIIVDTTKPEISLSGTLDATGSIVVRYEATDVSLNVDTLHLEARPQGGSWVSLTPGLHDVSHPDRLLGRVRWAVPANVPVVEVRASLSDRAGHQGETQTAINLSGPAIGPAASPSLSPLASGRGTVGRPTGAHDPFRSAPSAPARNWPSSDEIADRSSQETPVTNLFAGANTQSPPPMLNPYTSAPADRAGNVDSSRTPARLIGDGVPTTPPLANSTEAENSDAPRAVFGQDGWGTLDDSQNVNAVRAVNSRTFEVEYNLESVGPWGISKVELWGTHDGGNTWQSYGVDSDNRSPVRATVPESGTYGFRILVDGASGIGSPPPRSGDKPELVVEVDLQPPAAAILAVEPQTGDLAGHLQIRWTADDSNLEDRPVSLYYGSYADGPWSAIATQIPNVGSYSWRMERHLPERFFVRLEVRDQAGNVAVRQTPTPITINRSQPTGTLRGVRPVENDYPQNETARR